MRVEHIRTLAGPNIYTHRPALIMRLHLEELAGRESCEFPHFVERLLNELPGLGQHHCSKEYPGGFVERLHEGTYFGHTVEHVALELMGLAGVPTKHGKTRAADEPGVYHVVVEYEAEHATKYLLEVAVELVESLLAGRPYALEEKLREAGDIIRRTELGPSTRAIVDAAKERGIPSFRIGQGSLVQLGYGRARRLVQAAMSDRTSVVGAEVASDKDLTKMLLEQASIPVPRGRIVETEEEAVEALAELGAPVVVKPLDGRQGLGVSLNLSTPEDVRHAFQIAQDYSRHVLVEDLLVGKNYRVLVIDGRMVAASERLPCHVVGDGARTVAELIEEANRNPLRGEGHEKPLTKIKVDEIMLAYLRKAGRSLDYVAAAGEAVYLRESINLSTGGVARDVTEQVHESVRRMCERAACAIGLDICGVDLVMADISQPLSRSSGGVIEINASPGLRMHHFPSEGEPRDAGGAIVRMLFPEGDGRIPLISITGTNGKTTVTRMIAHVLQANGRRTGMTTTDGIWIDGQLVAEGDTTGPHSARTVLSDPTVEVAVLETARGGIARRGLGYDWSDIAVMTNIQPDHFGQDGIESIEDLVFIKSLIAERVREGGTLILNADDEQLARLMELERVSRVPKRVVYFSLRENHLLIKRHVAAGGTAYFVRDGWIIEATGESHERVLEVGSLPFTMSGTAEFQVANALAAVAACRAAGLESVALARALATFENNSQNPGRTNLYRVRSGGYVLLDYGHNPEAFRAICQMASMWKGRSVTGIVGVPGDRSDELIEEAGRIAARGFGRVVIKEDEDTRGRRRGEVAEILARVVRELAPERECSIIFDEPQTLAHELETLQAGDIIVMFYDKLEPLVSVLEAHGAIPVSTIEDLNGAPAADAGARAAVAAFGRDERPRETAADTGAPARPNRVVRRAPEGPTYIWR